MKIKVIMLSVLIIIISSNIAMAKYDFFGRFIPQGTPVVDGKIVPGEWDAEESVTLYKFFGEDAQIKIYLLWDANNLYLAADVEDYELWVDDYNASTPWVSTWDDDAFKWEIDPGYSRDEYFQLDDRVFAVNADGSAWRFDKGDGAGGTTGADQIASLSVAAKYSGTLNDYTFKTVTSQNHKDSGYVVEVAIPWVNIFGSSASSAPSDGYSLGMNFTSIEDDTGGSMDPEYYKIWKRVYDEITRFMGEEGIPENWAEFVISSQSDSVAPTTIANLSAGNTNAFSTLLSLTATGDNGNQGYAKAYDIRYSTSSISSTNWNSATIYKNNFRPQKSGKSESLKIIGLSPGTKYYLGVRAVDERGNASDIAMVSFTTSAADSTSDKGYLTVDPGQRYLTWENGTPLVVIGDNQGMPWPHIRTFYNGNMWDETQSKYRNFYTEEGPADGRQYLETLSNYGVNTLRVMLESYDISNPVYLFSDVSQGASNIQYNSNTLEFLKDFMDACADYNINVIIVPFDTFYYKEKWSKVPFSTQMGGPMSSCSDFFNSDYIDYLKAILKKLVDTVGDRKNLLAWDVVNEFDSDDPDFGWNRADFDDREDMVNALCAYMKTIDPNHMVYSSSVRWDPKFNRHQTQTGDGSAIGSDAAVVLNNSNFDFNSTHAYYHNIRDPNNNDPNNSTTPYFTYQVADLDNTIGPAVWIKQGIQFYYANSLTPKPYFDTEAGPIYFFTTGYDQYFTSEDDDQYFHNMIWAHLASGEVGTGLRWPGEVFADHALSDQMRKYQKALNNFIASNLNFSGFQPVQIGSGIQIANISSPVVKTGITDGNQGIIFLVNDERKQTNGTISGAQINVPELAPHTTFSFEFWDSYDETKTIAASSVSVKSDGQGKALVSVPSFSTTQVIKFYRTDAKTVKKGVLVTDDLWIRAEIQTEEKGDIEAVWYKGGDAYTSRGDRVIWGYFYADSTDVSWGDLNNPELFVKIWIDIGGRVDVNYFHVSVPDIKVYSNYYYDGIPDVQGTCTTDKRYIRQYYENGESYSEEQTENGEAPSGYSPAGNPAGSSVINSLRIGAIINTVETVGAIEAIWSQGGQASTSRGDQVVWGLFYADPTDVAWGSSDNPELFVKIWFDAGGRIDVNFFHVSVPDIEVYSDLPNDSKYDNQGTAITQNRYIRHEYSQ
ncbi:MAG: cellulase family glycosylhydrolase [Desulfobacula sp.]|uniref:sugar-binding protein n=1 Tax=Desulfobacula sp. TaxID=2593537 RepID=UPI0025B96D7D|nr:sugar-binding protein [Desulfobacula sp.]MCD4722718.1 cellulase family glycosylhydrolase [Desulfobacula sp.]